MVRVDETETPGPLSGLHVFVVDDNRDARLIYKAVLAHWGAFVTTVASAAAASRTLKQMRPDVIVTDLSMPGHAGLRLARWLRRRALRSGIRIPTIAITARDDIYGRDAMLEAGLDDWLVKPVSHRDLIRAINSAVSSLAS